MQPATAGAGLSAPWGPGLPDISSGLNSCRVMCRARTGIRIWPRHEAVLRKRILLNWDEKWSETSSGGYAHAQQQRKSWQGKGRTTFWNVHTLSGLGIWLGGEMETDHFGPALIDRHEWTDFSRQVASRYNRIRQLIIRGAEKQVDADACAEARLDESVLGPRGFNLQQPTNYHVHTRC